MKRYISVVLLSLALLLTLCFPPEVSARRGMGGGGFRSSRASGWGGGSRSMSKSGWSSSKKISSARGQSALKPNLSPSQAKAWGGGATDKALFRKAKANGTLYKNRGEAAKAFESKYGSQYGSKFDKQPAQRPDYIPQSTRVGSKDYQVDYNPAYGGYGYYGPGGGWMMYNVVRDVAMMSLLMGHHGYAYGPAPAMMGGFSSGFVIVIIIVLLAIILRPRFK